MTNTPPARAPVESVWRRRVASPVIRQLKQGITPEKVALTIALGFVLGIFPVLGTTTILCGLVAARLRLNQPIIQLVNYIAYPLQLIAIVPFYRGGETLFGHAHFALSVPLLVARFQADAVAFLVDFGLIAARGVVVWCLLAPPVAAALYFVLRPTLRVLARS